MVTKELRRGFTEINQILRYTEESDVNKIPLGLRLYFKEAADQKYIPNINPEIGLNQQEFLPETELLLCMLYCYYWSSEDDIAHIPSNVKEDAEKMGREIFQNYNQDDFFEGAKERRKSSLENKALTKIYKEPWYKRIFAWFKKK